MKQFREALTKKSQNLLKARDKEVNIMSNFTPVKIAGFGYCVPETVIKNDDLDEIFRSKGYDI